MEPAHCSQVWLVVSIKDSLQQLSIEDFEEEIAEEWTKETVGDLEDSTGDSEDVALMKSI